MEHCVSRYFFSFKYGITHEVNSISLFRYGVKDEYSGAAFAQQEASDTKAVTGTYTVALPDGRTQVQNMQKSG